MKLQNSDNSAILKILFLLNMLANVLLSAEYPYRIFYKQLLQEKSSSNMKMTSHYQVVILGMDGNRNPLHIVASHHENYIYLITAYRPDSAQWEADWKTRK